MWLIRPGIILYYIYITAEQPIDDLVVHSSESLEFHAIEDASTPLGAVSQYVCSL